MIKLSWPELEQSAIFLCISIFSQRRRIFIDCCFSVFSFPSASGNIKPLSRPTVMRIYFNCASSWVLTKSLLCRCTQFFTATQHQCVPSKCPSASTDTWRSLRHFRNHSCRVCISVTPSGGRRAVVFSACFKNNPTEKFPGKMSFRERAEDYYVKSYLWVNKGQGNRGEGKFP